MRPGRSNAIVDIAGLKIGHAEDARVKTGVTVLSADASFRAAIDVRGGAPGTRESDLLAAGRLVDDIDALVLSGGSAFGLAAGDGVMARLAGAGRGFATGVRPVPIVPAAILFDLANGGAKDFGEGFYYRLGQAAYDGRGENSTIGRIGAGYGATTGCGAGGLGQASAILPGGYSVAALVAVNAFGRLSDLDGNYFGAGALLEGDGVSGAIGRHDGVLRSDKMAGFSRNRQANTTIAVIATDADLDKAMLKRLAIAAHDGFGRAIDPAHSVLDGDLVYAVSTRARPLTDALVDQIALAHAAAQVMTRAIIRGVHSARQAR